MAAAHCQTFLLSFSGIKFIDDAAQLAFVPLGTSQVLH
jgi:hypothetical protein